MKIRNPLFALTVITLSTALSSAALQAGQEAKGVDLVASRKIAIKKFIKQDLKYEMLSLLKTIDLKDIRDANVSTVLINMTQRDLKEDISNSVYRPKAVCKEGSIEKAAATVPGSQDVPVCFNLPMLARSGATNAEIVGFAFHEHAHHYGYDEITATRLGNFMTDAYANQGQNVNRKAWSCSAYCSYYYLLNPYMAFFDMHVKTVQITTNGETAGEALEALSRACNGYLKKVKYPQAAELYGISQLGDRRSADLHDCIKN